LLTLVVNSWCYSGLYQNSQLSNFAKTFQLEQVLIEVWQHIKITAAGAMFADGLPAGTCSTELRTARLIGIQPIQYVTWGE
jgi:hypothetical protein